MGGLFENSETSSETRSRKEWGILFLRFSISGQSEPFLAHFVYCWYHKKQFLNFLGVFFENLRFWGVLNMSRRHYLRISEISENQNFVGTTTKNHFCSFGHWLSEISENRRKCRRDIYRTAQKRRIFKKDPKKFKNGVLWYQQ